MAYQKNDTLARPGFLKRWGRFIIGFVVGGMLPATYLLVIVAGMNFPDFRVPWDKTLSIICGCLPFVQEIWYLCWYRWLDGTKANEKYKLNIFRNKISGFVISVVINIAMVTAMVIYATATSDPRGEFMQSFLYWVPAFGWSILIGIIKYFWWIPPTI